MELLRVTQRHGHGLEYSLWTQYTLFYALFFYSPLIGICAAYLWRVEHHGHNWNLMMTMPIHSLCMFTAKFLVTAKAALLTQGWLFLLYVGGGRVFAGLGGFPSPQILLWLLRGSLGGLTIITIQLVLSMLIRSFALPVLLALCGSILGLLVINADLGLLWPYALMLLGMNANHAQDMMSGSLLPFFASCAVFLALAFCAAHMLLTRRDVIV